MNKLVNKWLFIGKVFHHRFAPREHRLTNRVFFIRFPLSRLAELNTGIFSVDRWNILSFHRIDHGMRDGSDLLLWAKKQLTKAGLDTQLTEIELQTFPRVLGYVFNPVSFWFCYSGNSLIATIAEVNNTFGASHSYVIPQGDLLHKKILHVSPFFKIEGEYKFAFANNVNSSSTGNSTGNLASIEYFLDGKKMLVANINGQAQDWTAAALLKVWLTHPLLTFMIVFYIHWHALILYLKGIPFSGKNGIKEGLLF